MDFHDTAETKTHKYKHRSASPEFDELYINNNNRKDSQCSDVILLSISGRTSRLSSIGSQGSAQSRLSNASHISITSGQSAYSQCSSPHKTLLETSFCGYRGSQSNIAVEQAESKEDSDNFEKVLLSRRHNPTEAVLVEGISHKIKTKHIDITSSSKHKVSDIELKEQSKDDRQIGRSKLPRRIISKSGVEYIYIPLKGPLPVDDSEDKAHKKESLRIELNTSGPSRHKRRTDKFSSKDIGQKQQRAPPSNLDKIHMQNQEPKYIRIKLKPDHCYDDGGGESSSSVAKPDSLNLPLHKENGTTTRVHPDNNFTSIQKHARSLTNSPKLLRKEMGGLSPSPSVPRRNSFATLFRTGPDSPSTSKQKRKNTLIGCMNYSNSTAKTVSKTSDHAKGVSTSVSSTESVDSKGKHKSVLSLFKFPKEKPKPHDTASEKTHKTRITETKTKHYREEKREMPLNSESIRIPLHSPTYYESKSLLQELQTSSQDSQVTVVEVVTQTKSNTTVTPISEENKAKVETAKCDIKVVSNDDFIEKIEVLDTRLQVEYDTEEEKNIPSENITEVVATTLESNKIITTTAEIELGKITEDTSSHSPKLATIQTTTSISDSLNEISKTVENQSNCGSNAYDDHNSSESERDVELEYRKCDKPLLPSTESSEIERKAIVFQQDSFEDELPYVPTTLPQERSAAIPILPIKQRCVLDMKTCPIERPRSTTPIHSSGLENYFDGFAIKSEAMNSEKLKISLPRTESSAKPKSQAETIVSASADHKKVKEETPPPLPPKGIQKSWINFEEVPERRKTPKRIQTIPSRGQIDISGLVKDNVVYTYVNPEECKCECHEHKEPEPKTVPPQIQEDEVPLLNQDEKGVHLNR